MESITLLCDWCGILNRDKLDIYRPMADLVVVVVSIGFGRHFYIVMIQYI